MIVHATVQRRRRIAVVLVAGALAVTSACTSSSGKSGSTPPSTAAAAGSRPPLSTKVPALPKSVPQNPADLAQLMRPGLAQTGFAHVSFSTSIAGSQLTGLGDIVLVNGQVTGLNVNDRVTGLGNVRFLLVNNIAYAKLPTPTESGKTYTVVASTSAKPAVVRAGIALQATKVLCALATYQSLVKAASSVKYLGNGTVNQEPALHYSFVSTAKKIPSTDPLNAILAAVGVSTVAMDLWVDGLGRPLKVSAPLNGNLKAPTTVNFSAFNKRFTIAAPPVADVDTGG
jgi:hypothetical protein